LSSNTDGLELTEPGAAGSVTDLGVVVVVVDDDDDDDDDDVSG
jgi:hypothetical protein